MTKIFESTTENQETNIDAIKESGITEKLFEDSTLGFNILLELQNTSNTNSNFKDKREEEANLRSYSIANIKKYKNEQGSEVTNAFRYDLFSEKVKPRITSNFGLRALVGGNVTKKDDSSYVKAYLKSDTRESRKVYYIRNHKGIDIRNNDNTTSKESKEMNAIIDCDMYYFCTSTGLGNSILMRHFVYNGTNKKYTGLYVTYSHMETVIDLDGTIEIATNSDLNKDEEYKYIGSADTKGITVGNYGVSGFKKAASATAHLHLEIFYTNEGKEKESEDISFLNTDLLRKIRSDKNRINPLDLNYFIAPANFEQHKQFDIDDYVPIVNADTNADQSTTTTTYSKKVYNIDLNNKSGEIFKQLHLNGFLNYEEDKLVNKKYMRIFKDKKVGYHLNRLSMTKIFTDITKTTGKLLAELKKDIGKVTQTIDSAKTEYHEIDIDFRQVIESLGQESYSGILEKNNQDEKFDKLKNNFNIKYIDNSSNLIEDNDYPIHFYFPLKVSNEYFKFEEENYDSVKHEFIKDYDEQPFLILRISPHFSQLQRKIGVKYNLEQDEYTIQTKPIAESDINMKKIKYDIFEATYIVKDNNFKLKSFKDNTNFDFIIQEDYFPKNHDDRKKITFHIKKDIESHKIYFSIASSQMYSNVAGADLRGFNKNSSFKFINQNGPNFVFLPRSLDITNTYADSNELFISNVDQKLKSDIINLITNAKRDLKKLNIGSRISPLYKYVHVNINSEKKEEKLLEYSLSNFEIAPFVTSKLFTFPIFLPVSAYYNYFKFSHKIESKEKIFDDFKKYIFSIATSGTNNDNYFLDVNLLPSVGSTNYFATNASYEFQNRGVIDIFNYNIPNDYIRNFLLYLTYIEKLKNTNNFEINLMSNVRDESLKGKDVIGDNKDFHKIKEGIALNPVAGFLSVDIKELFLYILNNHISIDIKRITEE